MTTPGGSRDHCGLAADALDRHPDLASVTARIVVEPAGTDDPIVPELAQSPVPARAGLPGPALMSILAGASVLRCDAFREVGGFSPRLWLGGEEELLAADLAARGYVLCYLPGATLHHQASTLRDPTRRRWLGIRNTLWFTWLRRPPGGGAAPDRRARRLRPPGHRVGQCVLRRGRRPALGPARAQTRAAVRGGLDPAARRAAPPFRRPAVRRVRMPPAYAAPGQRSATAPRSGTSPNSPR